MMQPAFLVGVHAMTLATVWLAGLPALGRAGWMAGAALLATWAGYGGLRLTQPAPPGQGITVAIVQGNIPQGEKWERTRALRIFAHYLDLTRQGVARAGGKAIVIWPESSSPFLLESDPEARAMIAEAAGGNLVLAGVDRVGADRRPRNSMIAIGPGGEIGGIYDKWRLVPFGEFQPSWFPLPIQIVPGGGFAHGAGPRTFHPQGLPPFGVLICYEAIFPGEMVDRADRPAWLVNITNDAWFGNSSGPRQHLAAARLRAVEEGMPLFRAANTGISAAFDAYGRELGRLGMGETGLLVRPLPGPVAPGPFARLGLWIPLILAMVVLVSGLFGPLAKLPQNRPL
jgi:apolipoprotein N-acyltransferase